MYTERVGGKVEYLYSFAIYIPIGYRELSLLVRGLPLEGYNDAGHYRRR